MEVLLSLGYDIGRNSLLKDIFQKPPFICHKIHRKKPSVHSCEFSEIPPTEVLFKTRVLKNFAKFTGKSLLVFNIVAGFRPPTKGFSCEFWDIFTNTFLFRTPPVAALKDFIVLYLCSKGELKDEIAYMY